jgi:carboxylate-amine ligase
MWAVAGPPPCFSDAADYDHHVGRLLAMGVASGVGELNWSMQLSDQVPGVEIRAADVQLDVDAATMVTALTSALVARALRDTTLGVVEPLPPHEVVRAACWHAARHGVGDLLVDLTPGTAGSPRAIPTDKVIEALLAYLEPTAGPDLELAMPALAAALAGGSGAERQRRAWADGGVAGLVRLVRCCAPALSAPPTR